VPPPIGFWAKWLDSVAPRTMVLIAGVPLLQLGFILSYLAGALVAAAVRIFADCGQGWRFRRTDVCFVLSVARCRRFGADLVWEVASP
jgi:hypothetical protein